MTLYKINLTKIRNNCGKWEKAKYRVYPPKRKPILQQKYFTKEIHDFKEKVSEKH